MRIRLQIGIFAMFMGIMLPLIGAMTGILYVRNADLAEKTANSAMDKSTESVVIGVRGLLEPIARTVELSAAFGRAQRDSLRRPDSWRPIFEALEQQPALYSLYYGFARNGEFLQMIRLPVGLGKFGQKGEAPPENARYVIRTIDDSTGLPADSLIYLSDWGAVVKVEQSATIQYDPRQRPWYKAAQDKDDLVNSGGYLFSGTGRPGLTLSQRMATDDKEVIGVFGADISLDALSQMVARQKVGERGQVFIVDEAGRLVGYPDTGKNVITENGKPAIVMAKDFDDPVVSAIIKRHAEGGGDRFRVRVGGATYVVSATTLPPELKSKWTIFAATDDEDFIGPIRRISLLILVIGSTIVLLSGVGVFAITRFLSRPIGQIIEETRLIRRLELDDPVRVKTPVAELVQLSDALDSMKSALRSFGVYVPKEVVRQIVQSGSDSTLGGARQPTTIMFTDLAGFTKASEGLAPEEVLSRLSDYFDVMAAAIDVNQGAIDKYIGDAIMALWNAPSPDPHHQRNGCLAMLACSAVGLELNAVFAARGLPPVTTRMGLHTGMVVVGNVGSHKRMQYTALGPAVNLASRIEGLNKRFGTELLVSGDVEEAVRGEFLFRPFGPVVASGTSIPIPLFELLATSDTTDSLILARAQAWDAAFSAYGAGEWAEAVNGFEAFQRQWSDDGAAALFLGHCQSLRDGPPATSAEAVLRFDSK
ncbi:adenylate/guanylate cyclase domain-containing protein [Paramagnetospirillum kuznetsovii]|uniref:Adenylate/guanylate cyclase domain-containing protein n=1 Tax=Paramagnetospirillum kuznetsovii TaxID=2053833 RepID=A0A364NTM4_9PROT|nr:adenylate/guanylate cyclase domain-containing protein [Paramagnetospirillum kuznetsovii]RAU20265.1 adenylate/guanylate cyclase domain-containing protein [Paramagnetospirillum kuznetsovii]